MKTQLAYLACFALSFFVVLSNAGMSGVSFRSVIIYYLLSTDLYCACECCPGTDCHPVTVGYSHLNATFCAGCDVTFCQNTYPNSCGYNANKPGGITANCTNVLPTIDPSAS